MITVKKHISILLTAILLISTLIMAPNTSIKGAEKNQIETKSSLFHEAIVYKEGDDYINVTEFGNNSYVDLNKLKNVYYRLYFNVELFVDATLTFSVYSQDTQKTEKKSYNVQNLNYIYSNSSSYNYLVPIDFSDYSGNIDVSVSFTLANGQKVDSDASVKLHIISSNRIDNGKCGDSLNWTLYEDGELYITGTGEMYDYSIESSDDNFVPWKSYRKNIKTVIADEGVTSIGNYAFQDYDLYQEGTYKDSITKVILPSTLKRIGNSSFQWCNSITKIKIPNSVTTIGKCAFRNCTALFEVVLSNSLSVIPQQAFQNCRQLESIRFPENIRVIGRYAFDSTGLKTITIPKTITELCQNSFSHSSLEGVNVKGDILVDIYAFASCNNLEYAHFSGSITFSGASNDCGYLFKGCPNLQSIAIPSIFRFKETEYPIQSYGNFRDSNALEIKKIRFNDNPKIIDNVIFSNDGKTLLWYNKKLTQQNYTVPDGVEKIAYCAFDSNPYIEHIVLPESLKEFGGRVFADCTNLNNVIIPDGIETLYDFQNCTSLRNIVIPSSVKQMYQSYKNSEETFAGNSDLSVYCESNSYANDFMSEYSFLGVSKDIVYCHFDTNGGNISKTKQAVIPNDKYWTLPLPTKQNADFEGWYTEKNGGTKITEDSVVNSDVSFTLYAHWNYNQVDTEEPTYAPVSDPTESINVTDPPTVPPTDKPTEPATVEPTQPVTEKPTENPKTDSFNWGTDNYNFNNSAPDYFNRSTYRTQINNTYLKALKDNLTNSEYQVVFEGDWGYDAWLDDDWGGSCYGMSSTALLAKRGLLPYADYKAGATKLNDLNIPKNDLELSSLITYYQMLQVKDVIQQQYRTIPNNSNETNIKSIIAALDKNPAVLLGFQQYGWGGHAILATGYEYGSWTWDNVTYQGCIKICDPNASLGYDKEFNIYFNTSSYNWTIPGYSIIKSTWGAKFNYIGADINAINEGGYLSGTSGNNVGSYVARINALKISDNRSVSKVKETNGNYTALNASPGEIVEDYAYILGNESEGIVGYNLYDAKSAYKVSQENAQNMQLNIDYEKCRMSGGSQAGKSIIFDNKGIVKVLGESAEYNMSMTFDENYPTDWFTMTVSGEDSDNAVLEKTDEGYILKADKLKNVVVKANNRENSASTMFSTDYDSAFIYEINEKVIGIKVDTDNDGTYDSDIDTVEVPTQETKPIVVTDPITTEPVVTEPADTEPISTEPITTNPVVTEPTQPSIPKPTFPKVTSKKTNPIKVSVKTKTLKVKKLKKKAQKVKAITVKNAQGKVTYKLVKSGITKKIRKLVKINSKGVITIKKWKKAKKGTYKIKVKVTAAGNSDYNAKTVTKTVKIKVK
jgi:uncharacterized repeat protein (TIGR02543 family)